MTLSWAASAAFMVAIVTVGWLLNRHLDRIETRHRTARPPAQRAHPSGHPRVVRIDGGDR